MSVRVLPIETPSLGDRSYLVHDGAVAVVVDPQRDVDRVLDLARRAGVQITYVFETHVHNDYVTGRARARPHDRRRLRAVGRRRGWRFPTLASPTATRCRPAG